MDTQTTQPTVLDSKQLENLQNEIQQKLFDILKTATFDEIFNRYGISAQNILKFNCSLDLTQIKLSNQNSLLPLAKEKILLAGCWCPCKGLCPCDSICL